MNNVKKIVLGGGCFWCTESIFQRVPGVLKVTSGYAGGYVDNPTYEQVSQGNTGHAEVVEVEYDENKTSLFKILEIFFLLHDPTTMNRQGNDIGTEYRSAIYFTELGQEKIIAEVMAKAGREYSASLTTEVKVLDRFYKAEEYHQNYYNNNVSKPYCSLIITPKLEKLNKILKKIP